MSDPTDVLLADDHPSILAAVSKYLASNGIDVVALAADGHEALAQIQEKRPTIALLDVRMPGASGLELTRLAARCSPETAVILFSGYGSRGQVIEALDAGARGFLLKNLALAEVLRAVKGVSRGGTYIDSSLGVTLAVPEDAPHSPIATGTCCGCLPAASATRRSAGTSSSRPRRSARSCSRSRTSSAPKRRPGPSPPRSATR